MHIWNAVTDKLVDSLKGGTFASFSNNGSRIAVVDPGRDTFVYAVGDDSFEFFIPSETQSQDRAAFSSNGEFIYILEYLAMNKCSLNKEKAVKVKDDGSHEYLGERSFNGPFGKIETNGGIRFGVTSENGDLAAWCEDPALNGLAKPEIYIVDCSDGRVLNTISTNGELVLFGGFDRQAKRLVTGGSDGIHVYDVMTGQVVFEWDDPAGTFPKVAISRNGRKVAAAYQAGSIKWWSIPE